MKKLLYACILILLAAGLFASGNSEDAPEIIISAAASLTDAMNEVLSVYGETVGEVTVTPTYASSGSLQKQIEQGAPADIFISASPRQMNALEEQNLILSDSRKDLLQNSVVLITSVSDPVSGIDSFDDLTDDGVRQIAVGEFESVPAGQYAQQVFTSLNILSALEPKLIFAKDVRQVLTYVAMGEVDAGIVYATDAAIEDSVQVLATAPVGSHSPVIYPAAIVAASAHQSEAAAFLEWLSSDTAKEIFQTYGFTVE